MKRELQVISRFLPEAASCYSPLNGALGLGNAPSSRTLLSLSIGVILWPLTTACVSQGQYDARIADISQLETQLASALEVATANQKRADALTERLDTAQTSLSASRQATEGLLSKLNEVNLQASELQRLAQNRQQVVAELQSQRENELKLLGEFEAIARDFGARTPKDLEGALVELGRRVRQTEVALLNAQAELERERRLTQKLKTLIDAGTLRVHRRAGRLVVELPGDIHFNSGQAVLSDLGKTTLAQLAPVLGAEEDRLFVVEGHTDNQPIRVSGFRSNWHLGSNRAETARGALVQGGLKDDRVAIASWANLLPACTENEEPSCLQRNRRVEVLLLPRFE